MRLTYFLDYSIEVHGLRFRLFGTCPKCESTVNIQIYMPDAFLFNYADQFWTIFENTIRRAFARRSEDHTCDLSKEDLYIVPYDLEDHLNKVRAEGPFAGNLGPIMDGIIWMEKTK